MAKKLAVLMSVVCIGLAAFVVNIKLAEDNNGPEITFTNADLAYEVTMNDADLLADVTAMDSRDGDVSSSLTIEDIYSVSDEDVVVVYVAKDNSNNISKIKRMLKGSTVEEEEIIASDIAENLITGSSTETIEEGSLIGVDELEGSDDVSTNAPLADGSLTDNSEEETPVARQITEGVPVEEKSRADEAREEQEAIADSMTAGCPRMYLTDYYIEVPVGTTIDAMSYVKDIVDESENFFDLSKKVQIYDQNGNQPGVNISFPTAGTYEFKFFVVDRQSNASNNAILTVVAE